MARRITEEKLTKVILDWLEDNGWTIICFDFPQSGTGIMLHPNEKSGSLKNKGGFIPDIVAVRGELAVFFENKDRFVLDDYKKTNFLRRTADYSIGISKLLSSEPIKNIFYGIGLPDSQKNRDKNTEYADLVDFTVMVAESFSVLVVSDSYHIFSTDF